jgi:cytoskeleton protein RodZ
VQVVDGGGQTLLSRTVQAGERVGLDGTPPLRLTIGNALGTDVQFRGRAVDLQPATRDNIARIELR